MDIIYCRGGDKQYKDVTRFGWHYGIRSDTVAYSDVYFLDFDFEQRFNAAYWKKHEARAYELRPALTMIPDWFEDISYDDLLALHNRLSSAGLQTMWTPKQHGVIDRIPEAAVIGISVPTTYAGFLPCPAAVRGRKLHLLGGHPDHQKYLIKRVYQQSQVASVDGNVLAREALRGKYWSLDGRWMQTPRHSWTSRMLRQMSARNIREYLKSAYLKFNPRRIKLIRWTLLGIAYRQLELIA
jgi:hypothetical protein